MTSLVVGRESRRSDESSRLRTPWPAARAVVGAVVVASLASGCGSARVDVPGEQEITPAPVAVPTATDGPVLREDTGVPAGVDLRTVGPLTIEKDATVIDGVDVMGCVTVAASDVIIRNSRIRCEDPDAKVAVRMAEGASRLTVEHSEIDGGGAVEVGIGYTGYTLRFVNIHGVNDGARFGHDVLIEDSWIHDMARQGDLHPDALQTTSASGVIIRRNYLDPADETSEDVNNAAIMMGSETGTGEVLDVLIEKNFLDGGNYTLSMRGDTSASGIVIRDNRFGGAARYGPVQLPASVVLSDGNVDGSGNPVEVNEAR